MPCKQPERAPDDGDEFDAEPVAEPSPALTREDFLGPAPDLPIVPVPMSEWGDGRVAYVRRMSLAERLSFFDAMEALPEGSSEAVKTGHLLTRCLCDEDGVRVLRDGDAPLVLAHSEEVIARLGTAAVRVNHFGEEEIEGEAGKSDEAPPDD